MRPEPFLAAFGALLVVAEGTGTHRARYEASKAACRHGDSGHVIVTLHSAEHAPAVRAHVASMKVRHTFHHIGAHLTAKPSEAELDRLFAHEHVKHVEASCLISLHGNSGGSESGGSESGGARVRGATLLAQKQPRRQPREWVADVLERPHAILAAEEASGSHAGAGGQAGAVAPKQQGGAGGAGDGIDHVGHLEPGLQVLGACPSGEAYCRNYTWALDRLDSHSRHTDLRYRFGELDGRGTTLYSLDTGVYGRHHDFEGLHDEHSRVEAGWSAGCVFGVEEGCHDLWAYGGLVTDDVLNRAPNSTGCDGHGTHTASSAAGLKYGPAKAAKIVSVQALGCDGVSETAEVLMGMEWAIADSLAQKPHRPSVITMSLGGAKSPSLDTAVRAASGLGLLVVVAAGNEDDNACSSSPSAAEYAMTVGATTQNDTLASFSNYGPCVDISAPGQNVTGAWPLVNDRHAAAVLSGTSMAAPFVAGVALQIMGLHPHFSADDVRRALICLSTRDALHVRDPFTHNRLLFSSRRVLDQPGLRLLVEAQHADPGDMRDATECFTPTEADSIVQLFGDDPAEAALTHGDDVGPHPTPSPDAAGSPSQTPSPTPAAWARGHARRRHRRGRSHTLLHDVPVL